MFVLVPFVDEKVLSKDMTSEAVLRKHVLDRLFNDASRLSPMHILGGDAPMAAVIAGVPPIFLVPPLVTSELHLLRIDDDDIVATINVRCEFRLVLTPQELSHFTGQATHRLVSGIHHIPFLADVLLVDAPGFETHLVHDKDLLVTRSGSRERAAKLRRILDPAKRFDPSGGLNDLQLLSDLDEGFERVVQVFLFMSG